MILSPKGSLSLATVRRYGSTGLLRFSLWIGVLVGFIPGEAQAQVLAVPVALSDSESTNDAKHPFLLPAQGSNVIEALDDYQQFSKRGSWDRAFKAYSTLRDGDKSRLLQSGQGFYLPLEIRLHQLVAELPPAGVDAYRVFYDGEAKKLLDEAQGNKELENLQKIVFGYLGTTVGDQAADRLGDLHFQRGEMDKAAAAWQTILTYLPDSTLSRPQILVKTATALARVNRWDEFGRLLEQVEQRYPDEKVTVAGQSVVAAAHLEALKSDGQKKERVTDRAKLPADIQLTADTKPAWQFRFLSENSAKEITQISHQWGWGRVPFNDMIPAVVLDSARAYMNYLGFQSALDLATGKLLWRNEKFVDLPSRLRSNQYVFPEQYGIAASDKWLVSVTRPPQKLGEYNATFALIGWDRQNGKSLWTSESKLKEWNMSGTPLIVGDRAYVTANKQQANELYVLAISLADGGLAWSTLVGTNQVDQRNMYYRRTAHATLLEAGDTIFVDSNTGGFAALDSAGGRLLWGFLYQAETPSNEYWYGNMVTFEACNPPLYADGVVYLKGMRSSRLCAIEVAGPKLRWQRPVAKSAILMGVNGDRLLLGGEELSQIELSTQKLRWATKLPVGTPFARPLVTEHQVLQFTPRGIFVLNKETGDRNLVVRGADLDSLGGAVLQTPQAMITVSNLAITAYPIGRAADQPAATARN